MLMQELFAQVVVTDEQLDAARLELLKQRGLATLDQWPALLEQLKVAEDQLLERLRQNIRKSTFIRDRFAPKAEARSFSTLTVISSPLARSTQNKQYKTLGCLQQCPIFSID